MNSTFDEQLNKTIAKLVAESGVRLGKSNHQDKFGIEIEAEFKNPLDRASAEDRREFNKWLLHNDGSLRGFGYEFVSPGPQSFEVAATNVISLLNTDYFKVDYNPSHRTSTHVHYNVQHYTLNELLKILTVYFLCEVVLTKHCGKQREGNLFCLRLCDAEKVMDALKLIVDCKFLALARSFDNFKYAALNVANVAKLGSIEFRQFVGTNNSDRIVDWLKIIDNLVKFSLTFKSVRDIMDSVNQDFMGFVRKAVGNLPIMDRVNVWDIDHNYSMVFDLFNYIEAREERLKENLRKKPAKHDYVFAPVNDLIEINQ